MRFNQQHNMKIHIYTYFIEEIRSEFIPKLKQIHVKIEVVIMSSDAIHFHVSGNPQVLYKAEELTREICNFSLISGFYIEMSQVTRIAISLEKWRETIENPYATLGPYVIENAYTHIVSAYENFEFFILVVLPLHIHYVQAMDEMDFIYAQFERGNKEKEKHLREITSSVVKYVYS